jgi:hypothetical protein
MQVKIIRRVMECSHPIGAGNFYPKTLEAIEIYYAPNRAFRVTREELVDILVALQPELEYRDGVINLTTPPDGE